MWGLALGACLVWVVTQAHAVSEADSQSSSSRLRLLLPSVSVKLPTRQGRVFAFNFRISHFSNSGARERYCATHNGLVRPNISMLAVQYNVGYWPVVALPRTISRGAPIVRRGSLGPALPLVSDLMQTVAAWLPARSSELGLVARGNKPTAKPFHMRRLQR